MYGRSRRFISSGPRPHELLSNPFGRPKSPLSTSTNPPIDERAVPPHARSTLHFAQGSRRPPDKWHMATLSAERHSRTLAMIKSNRIWRSTRCPQETAHAEIIATECRPHAIVNCSLAHPSTGADVFVFCHGSPSGRKRRKAEVVMQASACSATPTKSGPRCQAADPQVIMEGISARRRSMRAIGLKATVAS